ncbi:MAG: hypothetical protein KJ017_09985 [Alphaproteobacteria bacterium]|nr:hypothetical protein [Alphaproteobacteria bacterium]
MPTHKTNTTMQNLHPMASSASLLKNPQDSLSESVFMLSLLACLRVLCDERGWTHTGYFLEKAQESLMEVDQT